MKKLLIDTNVLLDDVEILNKYDVVLLSHVLRELDKHKVSGKPDLMYKARRATRYIEQNLSKITFDFKDYHALPDYDDSYVDNKILVACIENGYALATHDLLLKMKASGYGVETIEVSHLHRLDEDYTGVTDLYLDLNSEEDNRILADIYSNESTLNFYQNQYIVLWDKNKPTFDYNGNLTGYEAIDKFKFNGEKLVKLKFKNLDNMFVGKIKPINVKQQLMFDMLQDTSTTVKSAFGSFGVGKDFLMISHAIDLLLHNKIEKIVWVRNNVEVKDSNPIGFLPSDLESKLMPFAMPLADHLGGVDGLRTFLDKGKIEIQHLGFIRGRDIKNSILYCTEIENNSIAHVQLLLGRVGEGSQIWANGDTRQIDADKFKFNNGVNALKMLKGQSLYGQVTLDKTERSETAKLADLLDL
jgi:predicted ribonuclease YlaK